MTDIFCGEAAPAATSGRMEWQEWQVRARNAGLRQRVIARLTGRTETNVSMQLRGKFGGGVPAYVRTIIIAWELMTPEQREALIRATDPGDDGPA